MTNVLCRDLFFRWVTRDRGLLLLFVFDILIQVTLFDLWEGPYFLFKTPSDTAWFIPNNLENGSHPYFLDGIIPCISHFSSIVEWYLIFMKQIDYKDSISAVRTFPINHFLSKWKVLYGNAKVNIDLDPKLYRYLTTFWLMPSRASKQQT